MNENNITTVTLQTTAAHCSFRTWWLIRAWLVCVDSQNRHIISANFPPNKPITAPELPTEMASGLIGEASKKRNAGNESSFFQSRDYRNCPIPPKHRTTPSQQQYIIRLLTWHEYNWQYRWSDSRTQIDDQPISATPFTFKECTSFNLDGNITE